MRRLLRSWRHRVAVSGHSMEPTLRDGDWLLVDPDAVPVVGQLVVARDPRSRERLIVKRVVAAGVGGIRVAGDHPAHADEALEIGGLEAGSVVGRPWLRYWPLRRIGWVGSPPPRRAA
jgi:hypothetical protein